MYGVCGVAMNSVIFLNGKCPFGNKYTKWILFINIYIVLEFRSNIWLVLNVFWQDLNKKSRYNTVTS